MTQQTKQNPIISDYLYIVYKWKKLLIINLIIVTALATLYAFLLPKEYKATTTIMIPPESPLGGIGGLSSLLGGGSKSKSSISSLGSKMFGISSTSEDVLLGIVNSRTALISVIKKFDLMKYYEIEDNNYDKAIKAIREDIIADPNEYGMIDFSVINENPVLCAKIANYLVKLVDSTNIKFNIENAKNNRLFLEKRYVQNVNDLKKAEDVLYKFQKKYGIVAVPEQLEVTVKAAAEIESELIKKEMEAHFIPQVYGENSPQYMGIQAEINLLKNKVQELKNSSSLKATSNIFYPFKAMPDIAMEYLRNFREVEIQQAILEIVLPMYEQSKVEEQKSIPTIMVIDEAVPPQLKYGPKRAAIIIGIVLLFSFFMIVMIFLGEKSVRTETYNNPLQNKTANFYKRILKMYRIKF